MLSRPFVLSPKNSFLLTQKTLRKNQRKLSLKAIIEKLLETEISDLPNQKNYLIDQFASLERLNNPGKNIEILLSEFKFSESDLHELSLKLYHLNTLSNSSVSLKFTDYVNLLMRNILKKKILAGQNYAPMLDRLQSFKIMNQLTLTEKICRYFICLNAALSSGTVFYEMATSLLLSVSVITFAGFISLAVCGYLANYFINMCNEEDDKLISELEGYKETIDFLAGRESVIRLRCYNLILQIIKLHKEFEPEIRNEISDPAIVSLINNLNEKNSLTAMDEYINSRLITHPLEVSTVAEINSIHFKTFKSIYSHAFQSNWGPVISFLGGAGTLFFIAKTILAVAGLVAIAGSSIGLLAIPAGASILISSVFAIQHRGMNMHLDKCKNEINDFKNNDLDEFKIRTDQLKRTRMELLIDFINVQQLIRKNYLEQFDIKLAQELESKITKNLNLSNDGTYAGSRLVLFRRPSISNAPQSHSQLSSNVEVSGSSKRLTP